MNLWLRSWHSESSKATQPSNPAWDWTARSTVAYRYQSVVWLPASPPLSQCISNGISLVCATHAKHMQSLPWTPDGCQRTCSSLDMACMPTPLLACASSTSEPRWRRHVYDGITCIVSTHQMVGSLLRTPLRACGPSLCRHRRERRTILVASRPPLPPVDVMRT